MYLLLAILCSLFPADRSYAYDAISSEWLRDHRAVLLAPFENEGVLEACDRCTMFRFNTELGRDLEKLRSRMAFVRQYGSTDALRRFGTRDGFVEQREVINSTRVYWQVQLCNCGGMSPRFHAIERFLSELEARYMIYDWLCDATSQYYVLDFKLLCMSRLAEKLGQADYWAGNVPLPLPAEYYRPVD